MACRTEKYNRKLGRLIIFQYFRIKKKYIDTKMCALGSNILALNPIKIHKKVKSLKFHLRMVTLLLKRRRV